MIPGPPGMGLLWSIGIGYSAGVIQSDEPMLSKERWFSWEQAAWTLGTSALTWRRGLIFGKIGQAARPHATRAVVWTATRGVPAVAARGWQLSNWIRLAAPMAAGGRGIGFGSAAGGIGGGALAASIVAGYGIGAVVGTAISGAIWGKPGAQLALGFYSGGILGPKPTNWYDYTIHWNAYKIVRSWFN